MKHIILTSLLILTHFLIGCSTFTASQIMQSYVGKSIKEVVLDYGAPANYLDLDDGRRAFQWNRRSEYSIPTYNYATVNSYSSGVYSNANVTYTGSQRVSSDCLYTLYTTWDGNTWIVVDYKEPVYGCN